ncbi:MAG TPA: hypothetical protein PKK59_11065 [Anaerolineaceae bacterium]|nr:hypothetical protein [Anaerolineaceae bacterium]
MAGESLARDQRQQSNRISQAMAEQRETQERRMLEITQEKWQRAHGHLVDLVRRLDPEYGDASEKGNLRLAQLSDDDLAHRIHMRLRLLFAAKREIPDIRRQVCLQVDQQCGELEARGAALAEENCVFQEENNSLNPQRLPSCEPQSLARAVPSEPIQAGSRCRPEEGFEPTGGSMGWASGEVHTQAQAALCVMGETGMVLRSSILRETANRLNLSPESKELPEALERLLHTEGEGSPAFVSRIDVGNGQEDQSGDQVILRLTETGKSAYLGSSGKTAVENAYDRLVRLYDSAEEALLILRSVEVLEAAGYRIKGFAQEIYLNDRKLVADIEAVDPSSGEVLLIVVERDSRAKSFGRKQKWVNLWEAANGKVYVICEDVACQRGVQNEINIALRGLRFSSFLTNLQRLDGGQRSEGGGIWLSGKQARCLERLPY